jgi:1-aminocyclopropane-1-carboxylate deaminase/D-cysteine desulfhydrase-like pyridoxal-dependent ACC family enzyme
MVAADSLADALAADGAAPYAIPIGGSTATGALGYAAAFVELMGQCAAVGIEPAAIVHTSSSGGTHAGLVAGRALWRSLGNQVPDVLAIGVAKGVNVGTPDVVGLAGEALELLGRSDARVDSSDVQLDPDWLGDDYAVPTAAGDDAMRWAAVTGGWVLDRTYTGKGLAGLLGNAAAGRWAPGADVIFVHTGGMPAVFAPGGAPSAPPHPPPPTRN